MLERARGSLRLSVRSREGIDAIADLRQSGCGRLLFPARPRNAPLEAVIVNTSGGLTGGDRFDVQMRAGTGARAVVTTQACEKIYRSGGGAGRLRTTLRVDTGACLHWLPQETILFEGSRLERSLDADVAEDAVFVAAEAVILGRAAMGETLAGAAFRDSWRIRRGGRLVFAEETACDGAWAQAFGAKAALGAGAAAFATVILLAPDAATRLDSVRAVLETYGIDCGASVVDGLLVARMVSADAFVMRQALVAAVEAVTGQPLPRVWAT
jgi:urease accessory protein